MKLFALLLCIAVASASVINKETSNINKRGLTYVYTSNKNYTIFEEGWDKWDEHWDSTLSWDGGENARVENGEIVVDLKKGSGFSLNNPELESGYGILHFEFRITHEGGMASQPINLNVLSYDGTDYIPQSSIPYTAVPNYQKVDQPIMNNAKNSFIDRIKRFSWQNYDYEEQDYFTLHLKNIVYEDIKYEQLKHDSTLSFIDSEKCELSSDWEDISTNPGSTEFNMVGDKCVMTITTSNDEPVKYKLKNDKFFTSAQLEMVAKSQNEDADFSWFVSNSEDDTVTETENDSINLKTTYEQHSSQDFDSEKKFNIIKITPYDNDSDKIVIDFTDFKVGIITAASTVATFTVIEPEEPIVILDETGLHWADASWGSTNCNFHRINEEMQCTLEGAWPAFSFQDTQWALSGGTLVVKMKVANPDQPVQIQIHYKVTANYENIASFSASADYRNEVFTIPSITVNGIDRFAIQEASQQQNTFYIQKIVYFPPSYKEIPDNIEDFHYDGPSQIVDPGEEEDDSSKGEEDKYLDNGYKACTRNTRIAYADENGMYGKESNQWCAILQKNLDDCWSHLYGFNCCAATTSVSGAWGEEGGTKCGNPDPNACWATELGYECCTKKESEKGIVFVDESGAWGVKNNKWCGIK